MKKITHYRNEKTGELAPPHIIGTSDDGRTLYQYVEGWVPVDRDGKPVDVDHDHDGNWTVVAK